MMSDHSADTELSPSTGSWMMKNANLQTPAVVPIDEMVPNVRGTIRPSSVSELRQTEGV